MRFLSFFNFLLCLLGANLFFNSGVANADEKLKKGLTITWQSKNVSQFIELKTLAKGQVSGVLQQEEDLYNAWRGYSRVYVGYSLYKILDSILTKDWRKQKEVKFIALDGYTVSSQVSDLLKAEATQVGLIAYTEKGKNGFTPVQRGDKTIDPGPLYLDPILKHQHI